MTDQTRQQIQTILDEIKQTTFNAGYEASPEQVFGIMMSKFFECEGVSILQATGFALEDSNFHLENEAVQNIIDDM